MSLSSFSLIWGPFNVFYTKNKQKLLPRIISKIWLTRRPPLTKDWKKKKKRCSPQWVMTILRKGIGNRSTIWIFLNFGWGLERGSWGPKFLFTLIYICRCYTCVIFMHQHIYLHSLTHPIYKFNLVEKWYIINEVIFAPFFFFFTISICM